MNKDINRDVKLSAAAITARLDKIGAPGAFRPRLAVILGSGLGAVADLLKEEANIPYAKLPGFPRLNVPGHEGSLRIGTVGGVPVMFLKGRVHPYEGKGFSHIKAMIRTLKTVGVDTLFLTNAAGSLREDNPPGTLVAISDHINLLGTNPLAGRNDDDWGPRFPSMDNAWNADLRALLLKSAKESGVKMGEGVYAAFLGPTFETHAEIRMAKTMGADLVGMSTVPELIIARHCGLTCVGCSGVTNMGAGLSDEVLSHEQTLAVGKTCGDNMARAMQGFIKAFGALMPAAAA